MSLTPLQGSHGGAWLAGEAGASLVLRRLPPGATEAQARFTTSVHDHAAGAGRDAEPKVSHLVLSDAGPASRRLLLRAVRAIVTQTLIAQGWAPLHGACAVTPVGAVCLLGAHRSGKTTALLHLLASGQGGFLANDTVFLSRAPGGFRACGLPIAAGLRPETLRMFPVLAAAASHVPVWEAEDTTSGLADMADVRHRLLVTPRQLAAAFAVPLVPRAGVAAILGINYSPSQETGADEFVQPGSGTAAGNALRRLLAEMADKG